MGLGTTKSRHCANLLKQAKQVWLTAFLDELPASQTIEIHSLHGNYLPGRRNPEENPAMGTAHSEARGHLVALGYHFFQRPLNIGEAAPHHPNNHKVASRASHWLGTSRHMEYGVRGN